MNDNRVQRFLSLLLVLIASPAATADIYKCVGPEGVIFTQIPCSADAINIDKGKAAARKVEVRAVPLIPIDIEKFNSLPWEAEEIIEFIGEPVARYRYRGDEHWFYPNAVRVRPSGRFNPEILLRNGERFQIKWLAESVMRKTLNITTDFTGFKPVATPQLKKFYLRDTSVHGMSRRKLLNTLGEPDQKKVFGGNEIWEYDRVRYSPNNASEVTVRVELDNEMVIGVGR